MKHIFRARNILLCARNICFMHELVVYQILDETSYLRGFLLPYCLLFSVMNLCGFQLGRYKRNVDEEFCSLLRYLRWCGVYGGGLRCGGL